MVSAGNCGLVAHFTSFAFYSIISGSMTVLSAAGSETDAALSLHATPPWNHFIAALADCRTFPVSHKDKIILFLQLSIFLRICHSSQYFFIILIQRGSIAMLWFFAL